MDYFKIIKNAFKITFKHKFLWFLGILVALTESGGGLPNIGSYNINSDDINKFKDLWQKSNDSNSPISPTSTLVNNNILGNQISIDSFLNWIQNHITLIIIIALLLFLLFIVIFVVSQMAKAGLIWGVSEIRNDKETNFKKCFKRGTSVFWRILGLEIVLLLIILATISIYISPIIFMVALHLYSATLIWALVLILPLVVFFIFIGILRQYALRFVVIESNGVGDSLHSAYHLFKKKLKEVSIIWLLSIVLGIVISIILSIALLLIFLILGAIGVGLYFAFGIWGAVIAGSIFLLIFILISIFASGLAITFTYSYWTLSYLELKKS